jgi:hypothetical protein
MSHNFNATVSCTINHSVSVSFYFIRCQFIFPFPLLLMKFKSFSYERRRRNGGRETGKEEKSILYGFETVEEGKNWFHNTDALEEKNFMLCKAENVLIKYQ